MNVLMDLSDRSGAQAIGNSFVARLFFLFPLCISLLRSPSSSVLPGFSALSVLSHLFCPRVFSHATSSGLSSHLISQVI